MSVAAPRSLARLGCLFLLGALAACSGRDAEVTGAETAALALNPVYVQRFCPRVEVRRGMQGFPVYAAGHEDDPQYLLYQGAITDAARECVAQGDRIVMRIGVRGRALAGPRGPGRASAVLPLRIEAAYGAEIVYREVRRIEVPLGGASDFAHVEENVALPVGPDRHPRGYIVSVGFDVPEPG